MRSSLYGFSSIACRRGNTGFNSHDMISRLHIRCFATARRARASKAPKNKIMVEEDSDAFYIVRKGDLVGVYKSLSDCQVQVSSSISDPSLSVYKGYSLQKDTEIYFASHGLKDALYCINAADLRDDLFGTLVPCPFQQPLPRAADTIQKKDTAQTMSNEMMACIEFDGASKGNPGQAGAGVIVRSPDGTILARVREGLGSVTNNVAEYRALILGLKYALKKGYTQIQVQGDSKLICMQVQELWQTKNQNLAELCKEVKNLKQMFVEFKIKHVLRGRNSDADAEANLAISLKDGEVHEVECTNSTEA